MMYTYKMGSMGAKALREGLGIKQLKHKGSRFKGNADKTVINWGSSNPPNEVMKCRVLNHPDKIAMVSNKLSFFEHMKLSGFNGVLMTTTHYGEAKGWVEEGCTVVARTVLQGHSGKGIVLIKSPQEMVDAPLYTLYIEKAEEYRVHVIDGKVIDVQRKARKKDVPDDQVNWEIRNHKNGFIYQRHNFVWPKCVEEVTLGCHKHTGLDFAAYDVLLTKAGQAIVIEANTAPGFTGTTLENYVKAFKEML